MSHFQINNIKILGIWSHNLPTNTDCTICRCNLNMNSIYNNDKDNNSTIVIGLCNHSFHSECISGWLKTNNLHCPICSKKWEVYKKIN